MKSIDVIITDAPECTLFQLKESCDLSTLGGPCAIVVGGTAITALCEHTYETLEGWVCHYPEVTAEAISRRGPIK